MSNITARMPHITVPGFTTADMVIKTTSAKHKLMRMTNYLRWNVDGEKKFYAKIAGKTLIRLGEDNTLYVVDSIEQLQDDKNYVRQYVNLTATKNNVTTKYQIYLSDFIAGHVWLPA